jgi:hypothetical protein
MTRRRLLALAGAMPLAARPQMAAREVKPVPRDKPSGLPFSRFHDVAQAAGLKAPVVFGGINRNEYIIEAIGCGAAFLDYDNDGWLDVFLLSGTRLEGAPPGATNRLYKNNRDGTFTDVTEAAGLMRAGWAYGVTVGDYNNDGFEDLFLTYWGQNVLYRNNGDGTFTDVTKEARLLEAPRFATGCTWIDYERDGKLDLFVAHYVGFDFKNVPAASKQTQCTYQGVPINCGPRGLPTEHCALYRNNGDGSFSDVSQTAGIAAAEGYCLTAVAADFNNDGWPDIYVACDSTPSLLFRNNREGTFREVGLQEGVALNEDGQEQAGMGLGIGDFNLDGSLDVLKTHFSADTPALYANRGKTGFQDVTLRSGLGVETRFVSWGAAIADLDNDGNPDIFWVTGSVYPEVEKKLPQYPHRTPPVLFRNLGNGSFEQLQGEAGPALLQAHCSRGLALGDFDNDGDLDLLVVNLNEPPSLLRNDVTPGNHWLKVQLAGVKSNRSAIGARVGARYAGKLQVQEVLAQSSFLSVNDRRLHFGLGAARSADLEIRWPNGDVERLSNVACDQLVIVKEGAGIVDRRKFAAR